MLVGMVRSRHRWADLHCLGFLLSRWRQDFAGTARI